MRDLSPSIKPVLRDLRLLTWYDRTVVEHIAEFGGGFNAHAHICRTDTLDDENLRHINITPIEASNLPLSAKQNMVGNLHQGVAYTAKSLEERIRAQLERQRCLGMTRIDSNIDATPDLPNDGMLAIFIAQKLQQEMRGKIDFRFAPTPIFGFKSDPEDSPSRWKVFKRAAKRADYLSFLPEKDDPEGDGRIGFKRHVHRGLRLGQKLGKEVQFHADQGNNPNERGTEQILEILEGFEQPKMPGGEPWVWIVHMVSPSAYSEDRFRALVDRLLEQNVGVIVCPTAAVSMRQYRSLNSPIHNSIVRLLELIKVGVRVRLGTDNIADLFVPQGDGDLLTEIKVGGHAARIAPPYIWAKLAAGEKITDVDRATIGAILYEERKACQSVNPNWEPAVK